MDLLLEFVEAAAQGVVRARYSGQCLGETGTQDASVGSRAKQSGTKTEVREAVAMRLWDTLNDPVQAKPPELVGHLVADKRMSGSAQKRCERFAEISVGEARWKPGEHQQGAPEGLHLRIGEAQCGGALRCHLHWPIDFLKGFFREDAIVADALYLQQSSIMLESRCAVARASCVGSCRYKSHKCC